jgi:isopenicillin N synthase-like dioxygenase
VKLTVHLKRFFSQPESEKEKVARSKSKWFNGWTKPRSGQISPTEARDNREALMWQYDPKFDPIPKDLDSIPVEVREWLHVEDMVWEGTAHLENFQDHSITYWQHCLILARMLSKVFALSLQLPEDYFDKLTTYPGADGVYNFYPALPPGDLNIPDLKDIGLGSHTDLQCFTLLWQDNIGGLQIINREHQWIKAPPIPGTFVVNIGDFLMRMSNDRFKSTVHRVFNRSAEDRLSMPFFFGFNFNEKCSVLPTCISEDNPPKYQPISCGEVRSPNQELLFSGTNLIQLLT